ncbi:hypothetical protein HN375_00725 [bacterium]|nr:hypothetical protein [bacterium]MBT3730359.1 hypothetical protein [bacterium]
MNIVILGLIIILTVVRTIKRRKDQSPYPLITLSLFVLFLVHTILVVNKDINIINVILTIAGIAGATNELYYLLFIKYLSKQQVGCRLNPKKKKTGVALWSDLVALAEDTKITNVYVEVGTECAKHKGQKRLNIYVDGTKVHVNLPCCYRFTETFLVDEDKIIIKYNNYKPVGAHLVN